MSIAILKIINQARGPLSLLLMLLISVFLIGSGMLQDMPPDRFRIIFYNVENLFDTMNEPGKDDEAFTPEGDRRWTSYRLRNKVTNIYKALVAASEFRIPAIIGLCEVENLRVLEMIVSGTGFKNYDYRIIHRNSADSRGIDVALLYHSRDFILLDTLFRAVRFPFDTLATTRDILYVKGIAGGSDTLHVFVNHWPSRWGGQGVTEPYRNYAATVLRQLIDSVFKNDHHASILVMGDFNDEPRDSSLSKYLGAVPDHTNPVPGKLYNITHGHKRNNSGSYKYQGEWLLFDQFLVSGSMLNGSSSLQTGPASARIFNEGFLLITDDSWFGTKPFRSFEGFRYTGGYSDHLPVVLDIWKRD
jgi:hypothetical protein